MLLLSNRHFNQHGFLNDALAVYMIINVNEILFSHASCMSLWTNICVLHYLVVSSFDTDFSTWWTWICSCYSERSHNFLGYIICSAEGNGRRAAWPGVSPQRHGQSLWQDISWGEVSYPLVVFRILVISARRCQDSREFMLENNTFRSSCEGKYIPFQCNEV